MESLSDTANLLILASKAEEAKHIVKTLRDGGLTVHGIFSENPEHMEELVAANPLELILCCQYDPAIDLDACILHYRRLNSDVPLVVVADETTDSAILMDALRSGARDLTEYGDVEHLQLVAAREISDLAHRRGEIRLRERLTHCEQRERDLIDASTKAVAVLDAETGLPNRTALMRELDSRLTETASGRTPFALFYLGISNFSKLLQDMGLVGGLKAAARIGSLLRVIVPENAYLARIADDGYVLLIPDLQQTKAAKLTAIIERNLRCSSVGESQPEQAPHCSMGIVLASSVTQSATDLLDSVYRDYLNSLLEPLSEPDPTKPSRRMRATQHEHASEERQRIAARIQQALDTESLQLVYQPIVSLRGDSQEAYSVLVRLREDDGTLRDAEDFLAAAIGSGSMVAIDRWVLRNAIAEVAAQRSKGLKVNFFVNLAEQTLQEANLLIWICDNLREFQARGNWLTLQILEEHARRNTTVFTKLSEGLRKVKCRVAINRFGEGPNPNLLLQSLRLDYAKLSPNIGAGLANDQPKQRQLLYLTKACHDAGVKCVVTGIEDARCLTLLWTADIDYVEGFFLQEPRPLIRMNG